MFKNLKSNNFEEVKLSLFLLKEYFTNYNEISINQNILLLNNIIECMIKYSNEKIVLFYCLWILTNYMYYLNSKNEINQFLLSNNTFKLFELIFSINDIDLICLIIWLFQNISDDNNENNYIIITSNLFKIKILSLLQQDELINHISDENNIYYDIILQGFNLFYNLMSFEMKNYDKIQLLEIKQIKILMIKILLKYINTNINKLYEIILNIIILFYDYIDDDSISTKIISINIIEKILRKTNFFNNYSTLLLTNRVMGNYLSVNNIKDINLINKILNFLFSNLFKYNNSIEMKIDTFWTLGNLIFCDDIISNLLFSIKGFIELIINIFKENNDKNLIREILLTLKELICNINFDNFFIIINKGFFNALINSISRFENDEHLLIYVFQNISFFIEKGDLIKKNTNNENIIFNQFNQNCGKELLIKFEFSKNDILREIVGKIYNKFYSDKN